jgi:hypothetical protein
MIFKIAVEKCRFVAIALVIIQFYLKMKEFYVQPRSGNKKTVYDFT